MDPGSLIAFLALTFGLVKILGPIGAALAERLRGHRSRMEDPALVQEVEQLRARLAEVEERLDFAERLLSRGTPEDHLPGGAMR